MAEIIIKKWTTASVQVVYYIPDYLNLVNEFIWQTRDQLPDYPRIERFLDYWDKHIDGPIKEVYIHDHDEAKIRHVDRRLKFN
tara:strand:- start:370 stop:618 length:249 start_codon:yes stop_codon:yes gene_type:complete